MSSVAAAESKPEKKQKKDKSSKSEKKRLREDDAADAERKHKKSKSLASSEVAAQTAEIVAEHNGDSKADKKKKKKKDKKLENGEAHDEEPADAPSVEKKKKHKKSHKTDASTDIVESSTPEASEESSKKKKKSSKKRPQKEAEEEASQLDTQAPAEAAQATASDDAMDIDVDVPAKPSKSSKSSKFSNIYQPPDMPANPQFPFYTQTVSLFEPIYPNGWAEPVTSCESQHLRHLQNRYVPTLRGVLMNYRNVSLGEHPGRDGAATTDEMSTMLLSKAEAAVGFGWITADVDLFIPSRGAWMEGSVNLQTEGHIGVVCFGKFNASIEARRLPTGWKWVPNEAPEAQGFEETASVITADDHGVVRQIHSTGFWADAKGEKVTGKIRFRIRNFDVGTSGDTSYLSLEGTMLDKLAEKALVEEEASVAKLRKAKKGQNRERRRVPEFSMTKFTTEEEDPEEQTTQDPAEKAEILRSVSESASEN
ncbi:hypothetical protein B0I35DRAFT_117781 [Stachybotrys elegans]|uniref:RPA43 OB domain-containing protein n=1 Tax=Stachybotrys elegans TaxID=80388 RepID=A0A8K0WVS4_9HYPO|nr:hypothetical protein B0I35DRAFT_117781 [Stachybotrys elegans]